MTKWLQMVRFFVVVLCGCCIIHRAQANSPLLQIVQIDLQTISQNQSEKWVVGNFQPDKENNVLVVESAFINGTTGEIIQRPEGQDYTVFSGKFTLKEELFLPKSNSQSVNYKWNVPFKPSISRRATEKEIPSVFYSGGDALLLWNSEKKGRDMFEDVHSLPAEWASFVKPALNIISGANFKNAADADFLTTFLKSDNPLVGLAAARALNQKHYLRGESLTSAFETSFEAPTPKATEALAFWSTQKSPMLYSAEDVKSRNSQAEQLSAGVVRHATIKNLSAILTGLQAAGVYSAFDPFEFQPLPDFGPTLLRAVADKVRLLPTVTDEEKEAKSLLSHFQVDRPEQPK